MERKCLWGWPAISLLAMICSSNTWSTCQHVARWQRRRARATSLELVRCSTAIRVQNPIGRIATCYATSSRRASPWRLPINVTMSKEFPPSSSVSESMLFKTGSKTGPNPHACEAVARKQHWQCGLASFGHLLEFLKVLGLIWSLLRLVGFRSSHTATSLETATRWSSDSKSRASCFWVTSEPCAHKTSRGHWPWPYLIKD